MQVEVYETGSEGPRSRPQVLTQGEPVDLGGPRRHVRPRAPVHRPHRGQGPGRRLHLARAASSSSPGRRWSSSSPAAGSGRSSAATSDGSTVHVGAVVRHDVGFEAEFTRSADEIASRHSTQHRPRADRKGTGRMFKMSEYSFIAGVLSVALALGCYVLAFVSVARGAPPERPSPARPPDGGTVAHRPAQPEHQRPGSAPTARSSSTSR